MKRSVAVVKIHSFPQPLGGHWKAAGNHTQPQRRGAATAPEHPQPINQNFDDIGGLIRANCWLDGLGNGIRQANGHSAGVDALSLQIHTEVGT